MYPLIEENRQLQEERWDRIERDAEEALAPLRTGEHQKASHKFEQDDLGKESRENPRNKWRNRDKVIAKEQQRNNKLKKENDELKAKLKREIQKQSKKNGKQTKVRRHPGSQVSHSDRR